MNALSLRLGLLSTVCLIAACGGGSDGTTSSSSSSVSSSGAASSSSTSSTSSASSSATSTTAIGTITGFGSVHVNGIHFETEHAVITKDGVVITQDALRVGQVVQVRGRSDDSGHGVADSIELDNHVEGPIASIDLVNQRFVVLGQIIHVDDSTSFDDSMANPSLAGLAVGNRVEVSGLLNSKGELVASRIEISQGGNGVELMGTVAALNSAAFTFNIGNQVVDYSTAQLQDFGSTALANDAVVEVHGTVNPTTQVLLASRVELKSDHALVDDDADHEIEGLVTRFVSSTDFDVAGRPVTTNGNTRFDNGTASDLAADVRVEVEGQVNSSGVLVADKVQFRLKAAVRLEANVDAVDAANNTVTVLGVAIHTNAVTRLEDKSSAHLEKFGLTNINVGDHVEIRAALSNGVLTATRLEREQPSNQVEVRALVTAAAAPQITLSGITLITTNATQFENDLSANMNATQFFNAVVGRVVKATGTQNGSVITVTKVELEDSHED